ncbi:MAG: EAL domain-containing protein [Gemmatimonadales bacterium]
MKRERRRSLDDTATLRALVGTVREGIYSTDRQGRILDCNPAFLHLFGVATLEELGNCRVPDLMVDPGLRNLEHDLIARDGGVREFEFRLRRPDGRILTVLDSCTAVRDPKTQEQHYHGILIDITERKEAEETLRRKQEELRSTVAALRASEERYTLAAAGANDGIWDWEPGAERMYLSPRWKEMLGYAAAEVEDRADEWFSRVHADEQDTLRCALDEHLRGATPLFEHEHRIQHKDGSYRWVLARGLAVRDRSGAFTRMAGSLTDITERKRAELQLQHDAFHDALTELPNRGLFDDLLGRSVGKLRRQPDYLFAVLYLDLDRFRVLNESLGHSHGDQLLVAVAKRLQTCIRPGDTAAHLGGDEFGVLLDGLKEPADATLVAERIQRELSLPYVLGGQEVFTTASIGIALSAPAYERPEQLLRDADLALYRAKALGKARSEVFNLGMHALAVAQLELETDLRRALEREEFRVYYQPIVALDSGSVVGFEALARWQHPVRGLLEPAAFIAAAEETGFIIPLGRWVLQEACRTVQALNASRPGKPALAVNVNLSPRQFRQPDLVDQVRAVLDETGLPPACLRLEITEGTVMEHAEPAMATLASLRTLGVQVHLDDFGTGYSSLSYLPRFEIDTLKIDRSFVNDMAGRGENAEIVGVIVTLAHNLGLQVIAEGVETPEQLAMLRDLRCGQVQGYLFSRPVAADEMPGLLTAVPATN